MSFLFKNNATSRLYAAIDGSTTSIRVQDADGAKFPQPGAGDYFMVTMEDRRSGQIEICRCTARSGDIMTVSRAQEGTAAQAFAMGATVSNRFTAGTMVDYFNYGYDKATADARFINAAGDSMTGPLIGFRLAGENPAAAQELVDKDYVDRALATIVQTTVASATSLVYQATAGQTVLDLSQLDIYGRTYILSTVAVEPIDVFVAGLKKVLNNTGGVGDFTVDRPGNRIVFDSGLTVGVFIAVDVYNPRDVISGNLTVNLLKPMVPDGTTTVFQMRLAKDNSLVASLQNEDVMIFLDNVPQKPGEDYTALGSTLTFTDAPSADSDFWGYWMKTG